MPLGPNDIDLTGKTLTGGTVNPTTLTVGGAAVPFAGGTDLAVADGGTGASTAAAAATNLGLGTGDSPQLTAINLGHASDTTIARSGAGAITVEGVQVILSGAALGTPSSGTLTNCTGLPTTGVATGDLTIGTGGKLTAGTIELGAASDTTIARSGAGAITVEGVQVILSGAALGTPSSGTLTNCTGLPTTGIATGDLTIGTGGKFTAGTIELGAASDTTIARSGAGAITVEGVQVILSGAALGTPASGVLTNCTSLPPASINTGNLSIGTSGVLTVGTIEVGAATDTTVSRFGAADIQVEGNRIFRVGGTDVPVADGGTGASDAATAATNLGLGTANNPQFATIELGAATDTTISRPGAGRLAIEGAEVLRPAVQADQETGTSLLLGVVPGVQHFHPSACKCWGFTTGAGTPALNAVSYNMTSITDTNTGRLTVTIATDHSSAAYVVVFGATTTDSTTAVKLIAVNTKAAGTFEIDSYSAVTPTLSDIVRGFDWATFGDL